MRVTTAFFAGAGTIVVAIGAGLGGGLLLGDIMSPQQPKHPSSEVTRLEQRTSPQPIPAMNGATQPVPYRATTQAATVADPSTPPQQQETPPTQPPVQQASTQPAGPKRPPERNTPAPSAAAAAQPAAAEQSAARERAAPDDAFAKARDADLKRDARRAEDKRKAERRQQWTSRKRLRPRGDDDLGDVEASVREATEPRSLFGREPRFGSREPGFGTGRMTLFDD